MLFRSEDGYHFDGYSVLGVTPGNADNTGEFDSAKADQAITVRGKAEITAHAAANVYTVLFDANTKAAVIGQMEKQDMVYGEPQNLFANQFIRADATFTGWNTEADGSGVAYPDGQSVENLTEEDGKVVTLYAQWKTKVFTISFVDEDGTELQSDVLEYGVLPEYKGKTPSKAADAKNTYEFSGWEPAVTIATGDTTYTATYEATPIPPTPVEEYTITFVDWDGTTLQSGKVAKGTTPKYEGAEPTRPADKENTYKFAGWTPEIAAATADATYTATYTATPVPPEPIETKWVRLAGDNAFDTMSAIVDAGGFEKGGTVDRKSVV